MTNNNSSVRFTYDFVNKTIVGTKASFDKASKGFGPVYEELADKMAKHPDYNVVVKEPKKPAKTKQTYKGMNISFMVDFLTATNDTITLKMVNDVITYAEAMGKSKYPLAKRVFFDTYDCFDYDDAKIVVDNYRHQRILENAGRLVQAIEASMANNETECAAPETQAA
ncbi:MAG: hypothetical protein J5965_01450 [Aeriscardovia sp.]|nr:hypothetical protein [Aeriscardovia sp.]